MKKDISIFSYFYTTAERHLVRAKFVWKKALWDQLSLLAICRYFLFLSAILVFLTHVGIRQMPTWLPTWKAKLLSFYGTFLPMRFFCHFKSSKLSKQNWRKIPIPKQIRVYYIFQGILKIFSNIHALLFIFSEL